MTIFLPNNPRVANNFTTQIFRGLRGQHECERWTRIAAAVPEALR